MFGDKPGDGPMGRGTLANTRFFSYSLGLNPHKYPSGNVFLSAAPRQWRSSFILRGNGSKASHRNQTKMKALPLFGSNHVYRVLLCGEPFFLETDNGKIECGFHRNEYVLASSPKQAVDKAKRKAATKVRRKALEMIPDKPFELTAEQIDADVPLTRLLRNEGFLFFPIDS